MPMRSFRLPDDLDARLEESRGEMKRSEWLLEAVKEKLSRARLTERHRAEAPLYERLADGPEVHTAHGAGAPIGRADAFRAAAARRQAALRQKP